MSYSPSGSELFKPGTIGGLEIRNRFVRAGTSESMAGENGEVTSQLLSLYGELGANEIGLVITGHLFCHSRGRYAPAQTGIHDDALIPGLTRLTEKVKSHGARIFAQVAHAGSQSRAFGVDPLAPSPVPNALTGRTVGEVTEDEILEAIAAFGEGAARAVKAGFDGVHLHGANGYLISEFCSTRANSRTDRWGGSPEARDLFALEVVRAVRDAVPAGYPVSMKVGMADANAGLTVEESLARCRRLVEAGVDAIEVSVNVMDAPTDSAKTYVAVDRGRALRDLLFHRAFSQPAAQAYFRDSARRLRQAVDVPIILVGGLRTTEVMAEVVGSGDADFIAMARPLIREPDIVAQIAAGRTGRVDCTSCNLCLRHEGHHSLRCWRVPRRRLFQHAFYRLRGGLGRGLVRTRH